MSYVCILDYGSGNVKSVYNLFTALAGKVVISNDPADIEAASHIVLPGVGAFAAAMRRIRERLPLDVLERVVLQEGKPFLGICVGMQVLAERGLEFGETPGLGWIAGTVRQLRTGGLPLPHIGWNDIAAKDDPLLDGLGQAPDFYYVHSYMFEAADPGQVLATTEYGEQITGVIRRGNVYGVQFHPEKSQRAGMRLAKNFLAIQ
jgi:glutamine amidotransferase